MPRPPIRGISMASDFIRHKRPIAIFVALVAVIAAANGGVDVAQAHRGQGTERQWIASRVAVKGSIPVPAARSKSDVPATAGRQVYLGATVGGSVYGEDNPPWNMKPLETFEAHSGHAVAILQVHQDWGSIYPDVLRRIRAHGAVPMLVTEYDNLDQIVNGSQDARIRAMDAALTAYGGPVLLRWDWEMNGDWYPWGGRSQAKEWVAA